MHKNVLLIGYDTLRLYEKALDRIYARYKAVGVTVGNTFIIQKLVRA